MTEAELLAIWRRRLAMHMRMFRACRGRWPDRQVVAASKVAIDDCARRGIHPPTLRKDLAE